MMVLRPMVPMTDGISDITETLESIRAEEYTELPAALVDDIVQIEYDTLEDREKSLQRVRQRVEESLTGDN